ncbi:MAG: class I SAM-dependent RNA methyltransferase [Lentisphaerae bacterium]|nr:class I SAM-dependent RNA methyltransferase [Lentisphaerota bacterium]
MKSETLQITAIAYGGDGVGRCADGRVCFVKGTLAGEVVKVAVTEEKKRFCRGVVQEIVVPSKERIEPACPLYGSCPGCAYMHCAYAEELKWKERQLADFLLRSKLADEDALLPAVPSPEELFYRNKLTLHKSADSEEYGYYGSDNTTVLVVEKCLLAKKEINSVLHNCSGEKALFRFTEKDGAVQVEPASSAVLTETIPQAGDFSVAADGFFQVNIPVAAELIKLAASEIETRELLELYCGVGVFSISLAEKIADLHCIGIELNKKAIEFAKVNAVSHQVADRCRFYAGDAGKMLKKFRPKGKFTLLIDPPRSGVEKSTLQKITALKAEKIIYISCAADTLTRDLKELTASGYRIKSSRVLDMFPRTAHFETFTALEREP